MQYLRQEDEIQRLSIQVDVWGSHRRLVRRQRQPIPRITLTTTNSLSGQESVILLFSSLLLCPIFSTIKNLFPQTSYRHNINSVLAAVCVFAHTYKHHHKWRLGHFGGISLTAKSFLPNCAIWGKIVVPFEVKSLCHLRRNRLVVWGYMKKTWNNVQLIPIKNELPPPFLPRGIATY